MAPVPLEVEAVQVRPMFASPPVAASAVGALGVAMGVAELIMVEVGFDAVEPEALLAVTVK